jgi:SAM-dependent methyltransferase
MQSNIDYIARWKQQNPVQMKTPEHLFGDEYNRKISRLLSIESGQNLLDIGCGVGSSIAGIAKLHPKVSIYCCDLGFQLMDYGRVHEMLHAPNIFPVQSDGYKLPFNEHSFHAIQAVSYFPVLEHIGDAIKELYRVLKPGGRFLAVENLGRFDNPSWPGNYPFSGAERLLELTQKESEVNRKVFPAPGFSSEWNQFNISPLLLQCGFETVSLYSHSEIYSPSDPRYSIEYRRNEQLSNIQRKITVLERRKHNTRFTEQGMSAAEFDELISLLRKKYSYIESDLQTDQSWAWSMSQFMIYLAKKAD